MVQVGWGQLEGRTKCVAVSGVFRLCSSGKSALKLGRASCGDEYSFVPGVRACDDSSWAFLFGGPKVAVQSVQCQSGQAY